MTEKLITAAIFTFWILPVMILGWLIIIRLSIDILITINNQKELRNDKEKRRE